MSHKSYIVKIGNPCSESWQEMSPVNGGRFCAHCSKAVIDFSVLSDDEIIKIISKQKGNLCGRFQTNQLNKDLIEPKQNSCGKGLYKYLAGILLLGVSKNSFSSNNKILFKENIIANPAGYRNIDQETLNDTLYKEIKGRVLDSATAEPVYAIVRIKETGFSQVTDSLGTFVLKIADNYDFKKVSLEISSVGYKKIEQALLISELPQSLNYYLSVPLEEILTGDVVIIQNSKHKTHWWQFRKRK